MAVLIWGSVLFRIKEFRQGGAQVGRTLSFGVPDNISPVQRDYKLLLNYPDPFLKGFSFKEKTIVANVEEMRPVRQTEQLQSSELLKFESETVEENIADVVNYYGFVGNSNKNSDVGFVKYNNKYLIIRKGDNISDWKVRAITNDSLVIVNEKGVVIITADRNKR